MRTKKIIKGWGLMQKNGFLRTYGFTDCLGMVAAQVAIWPIKRTARNMALPGEKPVRVQATFIAEDEL